jgi:DNA-binding transcriptional LysR family regulator
MIQIGEPLETAELLAFVRTVDAKALSRAATELRIPRATLGRRVARLEERLGVRLLRRSTRSLALTPAGETFYHHARSILDAISQAEESVRSTDPIVRGDLRVSMPPITADSLSELLVDFVGKYPDVRLHVEFSTRLVDLRREGYDVALRATGRLEPGLIARIVSRHKLIAVASPAYLAKHGTPTTLKALRQHRCLTGFVRGELPESTWKGRRGSVRIDPVFSSNQLGLLRDAVLAGTGIAMLPDALVAAPLERGELKRVLPQSLESENQLAVVYVERELLPNHVRLFVDALLAWAPSALAKTADLVPPPPRSRRQTDSSR